MGPRLPRPSLTRTRQLVRASLALGYYQVAPDARTYVCPLDAEWRSMLGAVTPAHRITVSHRYAEPGRGQIVDTFIRHYADECVHTAEIDWPGQRLALPFEGQLCDVGGKHFFSAWGFAQYIEPCSMRATHRYRTTGMLAGHWSYRCAEHAQRLDATLPGLVIEQIEGTS